VILVTGGAGFIGSHLVEALVRAGESVRVLDDLSTGQRSNLAAVEAEVDLCEGSITDVRALAGSLEGVRTVFHHAACPFVTQSIADPLPVHDANATGTLTVLEQAARAGVERLVFASSCSVYGDAVGSAPAHEGLREDPQSPYAAQKLLGEHYCRIFSRSLGLRCVILRYYNVFGPRQDASSAYSGVISIFCDKLIQGEIPTIYGDGRQTRDFVYVQNVVKANLLAGTVDVAGGATFNVATGKSVSLLDLYATLSDALGVHQSPRFEPARPGDVRHSVADVSRARESLGFEAQIDFETGLRQTVDWMRAQRKTGT
jgi:UDP-glucose 4-epimerase